MLAEITNVADGSSANFSETLSNYKYLYIDMDTTFDQNPTSMIPVAVLTNSPNAVLNDSYNVNVSGIYSGISVNVTVYINLTDVTIHRTTISTSGWTINSVRFWGVK